VEAPRVKAVRPEDEGEQAGRTGQSAESQVAAEARAHES
jgi:hypothetical protein